MEYVFRVMLTDEAVDFLSSMPVSVGQLRENGIRKFSRNFRTVKYGNSARNTEKSHTVCFHFGTQMRRRW